MNVPRTIEARQDAINEFHAQIFKEEKPSKPKAAANSNGNHAGSPADDELLAKAFKARNGGKIERLFNGDVADYPSQSEADLSLCSMLAFWAQDEAQLDTFFRRSALYRDKWDERHGAMTYGEQTIEKAFARTTEHYEHRDNGNHRSDSSSETKKEPLIVTMDEIKAEKVDWLWTNRIPIGRLTLIDGDPGAGKSYLSLAVASAVSKGDSLPFDQKRKSPSNVLLMSCEDGYGDTVRPHLDQLGANVSRIAIPNPGRGLATTMLNASFIEQAVKIQGPALVIVDPVIAFAGRANTDKANDVRELLSPLMGIAEKHALACLIIRHFNKQTDTKAMYRGSGSIDFMAACRSAFIIVESEDEPDMRVFAQVKNSLGRKSHSISFYIDENGFRWGNQVDSDAEDLLAATRTDNRKREKVQLEAAEQFLTETLSNGPMPSSKIMEKAEAARIAKRTLWRAKYTLGIKASKERGTFAGEWWWRLPEASRARECG